MIKFYVANQMKDKKKCSFCGRDESEVGFLLTGLNGNICDECAERAYEYVQQIEQQNEGAKIQNIDLKEIPKPKEIKESGPVCHWAGCSQTASCSVGVQPLQKTHAGT